MYIFELIARKILNKKNKNSTYDVYSQETDYEECKHVYLPIDSTKEYLACNNCGKVIKNTEYNKKKNIFKSYNPFKW